MPDDRPASKAIASKTSKMIPLMNPLRKAPMGGV